MPRDAIPNDIVYQIFPDRWMKSQARPRVAAGAWNWREHPIRFSSRQSWLTTSPSNQHTFFGGDLAGIRSSLDHIASLGVTALYLTPIFQARSTHRYDTVDYKTIDPILGTRADFEELCADLRARGLKLVLDGVFNHTSSDHPWYCDLATRRRRYVMKDGERTMTWMNGATLPKLDTQSPEVVRELLSVLDAWPEADVWRLDAAHLLPQKLLRVIREKVAPRPVLVEDWFFCKHYFDEGLAEGTTNFLFRESVRTFFKEDCSPETFLWRLRAFIDNYPARATAMSWNLLENHDTPRFGSLLGRERLMRALVLMFALPGTPLLYHGTEIGMLGDTEGESRAPMNWDRRSWDLDLLDHVRTLGLMRREQPLLASGRFEPLAADNRSRSLVFERSRGHARVVVGLNDGYQPFRWKQGRSRMDLPPGGWQILLEEKGRKPRVLAGSER